MNSLPAPTLTIGVAMLCKFSATMRVDLDGHCEINVKYCHLYNPATGDRYFNVIAVDFGRSWENPDIYPQLNLEAIAEDIISRDN